MRAIFLLLLVRGALAGRVALLLHGESFRAKARQNSRSTGADGYHDQKLASLSHLAFFAQPLVFDADVDAVDVYVVTYSVGFDRDLERWYGPRANLTFATAREGGPAHEQPRGTRAALAWLVSSETSYEAVMAMRMDVLLKPAFTGALLAADRSKILFPFMCGPEMIGKALFPRVSDMFVWMPRAYFPHVERAEREARQDPLGFDFLNNHHAYQAIEKLIPGGVAASMSTFLPHETADSDSMKERNRIYRLAGRPERGDFSQYLWRDNQYNGTATYRASTLSQILTNEEAAREPRQHQVPEACVKRARVC